MSHALHALSDVTFNFCSPDPQSISCLPRINPVSVPMQPNPQSSAANDASRDTTTTTPTTASSGHPPFHASPHIHSPIYVPNVPTTATTQNPQQNQQPRPFAMHRPFGVSFYKIANKTREISII